MIDKKVIVPIVIILVIIGACIYIYTRPNSMFIDSVEISSLDVGEGVCHHSALATIMKYLDDAYNTSYFGNPTDPDLLEEFGSDFMSIETWAEYRNQPLPTSRVTYFDEEYFNQNYENYDHPDEFIQSHPVILTDITYDLLCETLQYGIPYKISVNANSHNSGARHASVVYGYSNGTLLYIHDTFNDNGIITIDFNSDQSYVDNYWYIFKIEKLEFDFL